ncbi:MAG: arginine repressor [Lachnospiraceae bacterium]|nr:arginine repressor [Lachnospiraceae bacterium]
MKKGRQEKILEIIREHDVETQEELAQYLRYAGFQVTQATVSRDIRDMKLSKVTSEKGRQKYSVMGYGEKSLADMQAGEKYVRVLREGFAAMDIAQNLVVIRTVPGMAMAVAAALDAIKFPEVLGCIAGDDTIMVASRSVEEAEALIHKIKEKLDR